MTITPEILEELKRLETAATPKEWRLRDGSDRGMGHWIDAPATVIDNGRGMQYPTQIFGDDDYQSKIDDFKFTVAARNHLRKLIGAAEENASLRTQLADAKAEIERLKTSMAVQEQLYIEQIADIKIKLDAANEDRTNAWHRVHMIRKYEM